jgi:hypothetical protein
MSLLCCCDYRGSTSSHSPLSVPVEIVYLLLPQHVRKPSAISRHMHVDLRAAREEADEDREAANIEGEQAAKSFDSP